VRQNSEAGNQGCINGPARAAPLYLILYSHIIIEGTFAGMTRILTGVDF